jgi:hypothetical protein
MKINANSLLGAVVSLALVASLFGKTEVGQPAPDFTLTDITGTTHSLSSFKGKTVVLEWVNPECPIVVKHYEKSANIPKVQKIASDSGIVWLQINSGHRGAQGDFDADSASNWIKKNGVTSAAYFRDQEGRVGRLYGARTTPHMYIVDSAGILVYAGGIDSIQSGDPADIPAATNYVIEALADLKEGKPVRTATSKPYGCSVKYSK